MTSYYLWFSPLEPFLSFLCSSRIFHCYSLSFRGLPLFFSFYNNITSYKDSSTISFLIVICKHKHLLTRVIENYIIYLPTRSVPISCPPIIYTLPLGWNGLNLQFQSSYVELCTFTLTYQNLPFKKYMTSSELKVKTHTLPPNLSLPIHCH